MLQPTEIYAWVQLIIGLGALVAMFYGGYRWVKAWLKRKFGPIVSEIFAMPRDMSVLQQSVSTIRREVLPNGGSSLRDSLSRVEKTQKHDSHAIATLSEQCTLIAGTMRINMETDGVARFECSPDGRNTWVNKTYCNYLACQPSDLLGFGFLTLVAPEDREEVRTEWAAAREDKRPYHKKYSMIRMDGTRIFVDVVAAPILMSDEPILWVGQIRRLDLT